MQKIIKSSIFAVVTTLSISSMNSAQAMWNPFSKCFGGGDIDATEIMENASQKLDQVIELTDKTIDTVDKVNQLTVSVADSLASSGVIQDSTLKVIKEFARKVDDGVNISDKSVYEIKGYKAAISEDLEQLNNILADGKITKDEAIVLSEHLPELLEFVDKWDKTGDTKEQVERIKAALETAAKISDAVKGATTATTATTESATDTAPVVVQS